MAKGNRDVNSSSAGKGTPYWYEWSVGLLRVVEMLYPESKISSVSFQEVGIKGWDDVVIRYTNGRTDYIQVKHSREGNNITFGSFVNADENGVSLLEELFGAWRKMHLTSATAKCVVFTNREAGERVYEGRPPLSKFMVWLKGKLENNTTLNKITAPKAWKSGWVEWKSKLSAGTDDEQIDFLRALSLDANQPQLEELQTSIQGGLADAFGTSFEKAAPLLHAFNDALKDWTVRNVRVSAEDAFRALILPGDLEVVESAPPPPAPFFPTREKEALLIESSLIRDDAPPVFFLSAEPGAGKTSVLSRIELRRTERRLSGIVGLRYFAFRPITPESPLIPADADFRVKPESLWFSLLSQFRRELDGRLSHYRVPIRNNLLTWQDARGHVLRLADRIGTEMGRRFVIVIDGIDHAARAGRARYDAKMARDFFASIPSPTELKGKQIRLLIAGQPAEFYPEYPVWLRSANTGVQRLQLGLLQTDDIAALLRKASLKMPGAEWDAALQVIADAAKGNTLAIVFAVEEAKACVTVSHLDARLQQRGLNDGLQAYYESIWKYAFANLPAVASVVGAETALAGSLSLLKERATGELLTNCFPTLGLGFAQWMIVLANLGPLIVREGSGFRVLHNDVRIFLTNYLAGRPDAEKKWVSSTLADYYLLPTSDRRAAHASLLSLLRESDRAIEWSRVFNVDWVFEAAAYDVPFTEVLSECEFALRTSVELRDWIVIHELACATETVNRWQERMEGSQEESEDGGDKLAPFFPPSELTVVPFERWTLADVGQVAQDVQRILDAGEAARAVAVLKRWFTGLTVCGLGERFFEEKEEEDHFHGHRSRTQVAGEAFKNLGAVCRGAGYYFEDGENLNERNNNALFYFEQGWVEQSCLLGPFTSLAACFRGRIPRYFNGCALAVRKLASAGYWKLVRRLLRLGHDNRAKFPSDFQIVAPWFCLQSGAQKWCPGWLEGLKTSKIYFSSGYDENLEGPLMICQARGWLEPQTHSATIAREIFNKSEQAKRSDVVPAPYLLLFRSAAVLGRFASLQSKGKLDAARDIFRPSEIQELVSALWSDALQKNLDFSRHCQTAGDLAKRLVQAFFPLSVKHANALLEVGQPIAEKSWGGYRFDGVWHLFYISGNHILLKKWLYNILGPTGWLWEESADSRRSTAEEYLPFARALGENALADEVERRLRWFRISYRGHKDYSFGWPIIWFKKLSEVDPTCIEKIGYRLLSLCEACSAQGDNRERWEMNTCIGAAAIAAGPTAVYRLLMAEQPSRGTEDWLGQAGARFVNGLTEYLSNKGEISAENLVVCWCVAVGMSRWYENDDVSALKELREALFRALPSVEEQKNIQALFKQITPGEAVREPTLTETTAPKRADKDENFANWRDHLEEGLRLTVKEALWAIRQLKNQNKIEENLLVRIFESVGKREDFSGRWNSEQELIEIVRLVPDSALWFLVKAAVAPAGNEAYWWQPVAENLQAIVLARCVVNGSGALEAGLTRLLDMHERWARGGDRSLALPVVHPGDGLVADTWTGLAVQLFSVLLSSRFSIALEAALSGVDALVSFQPSAIPSLFKAVGGDEWKLQWLLTAAEVWALKFHSELVQARLEIEQILATGPLHSRLQAWIVLSLLHRTNEISEPVFKAPKKYPAVPGGITNEEAVAIFYTEAETIGTFRRVDRYNSARSTIQRVEETTGLDFSVVEQGLAPTLLHQQEMRLDERPWEQRIRYRMDSYCVGERTVSALDREFDNALFATPLSKAEVGNFAYGYLHSEDGWALHRTPEPHPCISNWPKSDALAGRGEQLPTSQKLRNEFLALAYEQGIASDEIVIGAKLRAFSWKEDFEYCCWWQEAEASGNLPTTVSGRTFPWLLGEDWWEPAWPVGRRPLCFISGGLQQLLRCAPDVVPSRLWRTLFGWVPSPDNPFLWTFADKPVARFEVLHGPVNYLRSHPARQPILHRWVSKRDAWGRVTKLVRSVRWREDFRREPYAER